MERRRWGWTRRRGPLVVLVIAAVAGVTVALTGAARPVPGLEFLQSGHWIASEEVGGVVHVDGANKKTDAEVAVPGMEPGSRVVQGETSGYVVGRTNVTEFGKSTLTVEKSTPLPRTGERPVLVEVAGGPYLVYLETGQVARLGVESLTLSAGGRVGPPVTSTDGTVWLHRTDTGAICKLARGGNRLDCPAVAPAGHTGGLTVSADKPVFVDSTTDTMSTVGDKGLGEPVPLGFDMAPNARLAPADVAGKIAVLDPGGPRMYLVDAHLDDKGALPKERAQAAKVDLPSGDYAGPSVTGEAVVLLDHGRSTVRTFGGDGRERKTTPIPAEKGKPELVRGEDARVYVDGAEGKHVVVVDRDGSISPVPVVGAKPEDPKQPAPPPAEPPVEKPADKPAPPPVVPDLRPTNPGKPVPPSPPKRETPQPPPPIPATPPGMTPNLTVAITTKQVDATVTWGAAAPNGAPVTAYHVSWQRDDGSRAGSVTLPPTQLSHVIEEIWSGKDIPFTVTVVAENSAGRSAPASRHTAPPLSQKAISLGRGTFAEECGRPECYWMRVVMTGFEPNTWYDVMPHSSDPGYRNEGKGVETDENGRVEFEAFYYHGVGHTVWVETDGIESNRMEWQ